MDAKQLLQIADAAIFNHAGKHLSDVETAILLGAVQGQTYEQIAEESGYAVSYVKRDVGPKLWKLLSKALGEPISKTSFQIALERYKKSALSNADREMNSLTSWPLRTLTDWGEALDVSVFYGRDQELRTLNQWILQDRCRLIGLLGMGGIGKSSLSVKLAQQLVEIETLQPFDYIIWRSLRNAPPLATLLGEIIPLLSDQQDTRTDANLLLYYLRQHRCLVILDNLETILNTEQAGQFRPGYEDYGELLRVVGETVHQSCLIVTSREKPAEMTALEGIECAVRSLVLLGLGKEALALFATKGLTGSATDQQTLIDLYSGNPLALKIVATSIQDLFDGDIHELLAHGVTLFNGVRRLLEQQFSRLSPLEQTVMYWLAINREWTNVAQLCADIVPAVSKARVLETLETLRWRSLIETQSGNYTQQPVVMEYVTEILIQQVCQELLTNNQLAFDPQRLAIASLLPLFITHALIKTTVKDYIRASQVRLILQPIAEQFQAIGTPIAIQQQIQRILNRLRPQPLPSFLPPIPGYGGGNLLNLCCQLQLDLTGYDFSHLTIQHAYLQGKTLHRVNLAHSDLRRSIFTQTFGGILSLAFSPDGKLLATGDSSNHVCLWRIADGQLIQVLHEHVDWVRAVCFSHAGRILISGSDDQTIRFWDISNLGANSTGRCLKVLSENSSRIGSIALSPDDLILASSSEDHTVWLWDVASGQALNILQGHTQQVWCVEFSPVDNLLASSGEDHYIKLWDGQTGKCLNTLEGHTKWIMGLAFSPDGRLLASASDDQTIRLWDTQTGGCLRTLKGHTNCVRAVTFSCDGWRIASASDDQTIRLWDISTGRCLHTLTGHTPKIWSLATSKNYQGLLASGSDDQTIRLWDVDTGQCLKTLQGHTQQIWGVAISPDGATLATSGERMIRLWNMQTGICYQTLVGHTARVGSVAISPDGRTLVSGSEDTTVRLWDLQSGQCLKVFKAEAKQVWSVAFSPQGDLIASGNEDQSVRLWDIHTGQCIHTLRGHANWVWKVGFSPDGRLLASASYDQTIKLWDVTSGKCLKTLHSRLD